MANYNDIYDRANTFATLAYNLGELIIKSERLRFELAVADKSLDIVTEKKTDE